MHRDDDDWDNILGWLMLDAAGELDVGKVMFGLTIIGLLLLLWHFAS